MILTPPGALHESMAHERLKAYVCVLYDSPCAPLLLPWLGEVEGTSLAMSQAKASPAPAHVPMFRVPTVLRRVPSAVPQTVVGHGRTPLPFANRLELCVQTSRPHSVVCGECGCEVCTRISQRLANGRVRSFVRVRRPFAAPPTAPVGAS